MKKLYALGVLITLVTQSMHADVITDIGKASKQLFGDVTETSQIFTSVIDEKKKLASTLADKKIAAQEALQEFSQKEKLRLDELSNQIARIKNELKQEPENYQFLDKKLEILNELYQVLNDIAQSHEHSLSILTDHLKLINEYLQDPELKGFTREYLENRPYSFEDLQGLNELIFGQEKNVDYLQAQEKNANLELEHRKRSAQGTIETYKKRQEALNKLAQEAIAGQVETEDFFGFDVQQKSELLRLEAQLYEYKKKLDELRVQEIEYKISFIKSKVFIAKIKLDALRAAFRRIKPLIKIREAEVLAAKAEFAKKKQASFLLKENYRQEIERIAAEKERKTRALTTLSKRYNIPLERDVDMWDVDPRETVASYVGICEVGALNEQVLLLERKRELLEAQLVLEEERINEESLAIDVKESYYKITSRHYVSEEEIRKEIKQYGTQRAKINAAISRAKEKQNAVIDMLNIKKRASENIKILRDSLQKQRTALFGNYAKEYNRCIALLNESETRINQEIDLISKTSSIYTDIIAIAENALKHIEFIVGELDAITIWYRPEYAISWQGIQNIIPDLERFGQEVYSFIGQMSPLWFMHALERGVQQPVMLFYVLLKILLIIAFIAFIRMILPPLHAFIITLSLENTTLNMVRLLCAYIVECAMRYFAPLAVWAVGYLMIRFDVITDHYVHILFYMASIPYLLYLAYVGLQYFVIFNARHNYEIVSHDYLRRFIIVMSVLVYATIAIACFRQALILGIYHKSELPAILLAVNFIVFQICLIFLITKEQVLSIIPRRGSFWQWLHEFIDHYYYPILALLILIIVLSNPYVGFGRLVLFALRGLVYTIILIRLMFFVHEMARKLLSQVFFSSDEEVVRERFVYAKSWYGLFVIFAFLVIAIIGAFLAARIWGWFVSLKDVHEWLETPLIFLGQDVRPVTAFSIFQILLFCLGGFALSILVNRFVLRRIFDLLLVDTGVQNTIASFTRYLIVIAAVMLGFQNVGLGSLVIYLTGALILSIGWVIKDPISDFMSYFIILVQRPVKIGDYVWLSDEVMGVVRKITPRSVIIRRRNSTTIIVPNTQILNKPITNWNYVQGFCAFDDFTVTVGYKEDPEKVKSILMQVLDKHPYVLKSPKPVIRLEAFTEAGMEFLVRGFISSNYTLDQWDIASDIRIAIVKELRKQGIEISVPMRVLATIKSPHTVITSHEEIKQ
jgi:small-conductance mechanosensitive channel